MSEQYPPHRPTPPNTGPNPAPGPQGQPETGQAMPPQPGYQPQPNYGVMPQRPGIPPAKSGGAGAEVVAALGMLIAAALGMFLFIRATEIVIMGYRTYEYDSIPLWAFSFGAFAMLLLVGLLARLFPVASVVVGGLFLLLSLWWIFGTFTTYSMDRWMLETFNYQYWTLTQFGPVFISAAALLLGTGITGMFVRQRRG